MSDYFTTTERLLKLQIVSESWRGTPFMPNAAIKGAGVSCQKLVTAIYKEAGFLPPEFEAPDGPMNWARAQKESQIVKFMASQTKYFSMLDFPGNQRPRAGDMLGFRIDGCVHHSGVMFSASDFVHCWRVSGVMFSAMHDASYLTRLAKIWRPVEWGGVENLI